jgi:hypothetical protein
MPKLNLTAYMNRLYETHGFHALLLELEAIANEERERGQSKLVREAWGQVGNHLHHAMKVFEAATP